MNARSLVLGAGLVGVLLTACGEDAGAVASDWPTVRDEILVPGCGFSSCHGAGESDFTVTTADLYAELVNVPSSQVPEQMRVVPGDPDASYLIWKLTGQEGMVGDPMPPSGSLSEEKLAAIRQWIEDGALQE